MFIGVSRLLDLILSIDYILYLSSSLPHVVCRLPISFPYLFCPLAPQPATSSLSVACLPERGALNGFGVPLATSPGT